MIVALDLETDRQTVSYVEDTRILFAGFHQHSLSSARQPLDLQNRVLIGAMLRPHHGVQAQLYVRRIAAKNLADGFELVSTQTVFERHLKRDRGVGEWLGIRHG
jgi:hypothetical protein